MSISYKLWPFAGHYFRSQAQRSSRTLKQPDLGLEVYRVTSDTDCSGCGKLAEGLRKRVCEGEPYVETHIPRVQRLLWKVNLCNYHCPQSDHMTTLCFTVCHYIGRTKESISGIKNSWPSLRLSITSRKTQLEECYFPWTHCILSDYYIFILFILLYLCSSDLCQCRPPILPWNSTSEVTWLSLLLAHHQIHHVTTLHASQSFSQYGNLPLLKLESPLLRRFGMWLSCTHPADDFRSQ